MKGNGRMADYIDRQAAIDMFQRQAYDDWNQGAGTTWANAFSEAAEWGTVAVDPKTIPMQTHLIVDGYDMEFVARDTGSGVNGNHIDIYVPVSHSEALKMGQGERRKVWRVQ